MKILLLQYTKSTSELFIAFIFNRTKFLCIKSLESNQFTNAPLDNSSP